MVQLPLENVFKSLIHIQIRKKSENFNFINHAMLEYE
jgi:hypothetical protein